MNRVLVFALVATAAVVTVLAASCTNDSQCTASVANCTDGQAGFCHQEPGGALECHCHNDEEHECTDNIDCKAECLAQGIKEYSCDGNHHCHCYKTPNL